jgi:hypothetical protein
VFSPATGHGLIEVLRDPPGVARLAPSALRTVILQARRAGLLARLGESLDDARVLDGLPRKAQEHIASARLAAQSSQTAVGFEINRLCRALVGIDTPIILLKGAAYMKAGLPIARGRFIGDLDVMVPRDAIDHVEQTLLDKGWKAPELDRYDERYYRQWSHEIPPLTHPDRETPIDLHHTIAPPTGRLRPDAGLLITSSLPVSPSPLRVLAPADMVLHSTIHLFNDEVGKPLRDLVDLDALLRHFGADAHFWDSLVQRARELGLGRPLHYMLQQTRALLGTPIPPATLEHAAAFAPSAVPALIMDRAFSGYFRSVPAADGAPQEAHAAHAFLYVRRHWMRLPPAMLVRHLAHKAARRLSERFAQRSSANA